jgi:thiol-disulfide isomerase/thioredoxin
MTSSNHSTQRSFWTPIRIGLIGSALLLIVAIATAFLPSDLATDSESASENRSQPDSINAAPRPATRTGGAPAALSAEAMETNFKLLDGKSRKLSDYSGKILVIDLWATWCGPCRQEIPHLVEMAREYKSKGVEIIGLTTEDPAMDAETVKEFTRDFKINYPIGWANFVLQEGLMNGRGNIPQTIIVGRDGKIKKHFVGFNPIISPPQMKAVLDEAVAE